MHDVTHHPISEKSLISLTPAAKRRVIAYLTDRKQTGLRLSVKKTGCSGLSYVLNEVNEPHVQDVVVPLEHAFFICIDKASYPYLKGIALDYVKQGINQKFVFNNPNQTGECGCGESFTVDED